MTKRASGKLIKRMPSSRPCHQPKPTMARLLSTTTVAPAGPQSVSGVAPVGGVSAPIAKHWRASRVCGSVRTIQPARAEGTLAWFGETTNPAIKKPTAAKPVTTARMPRRRKPPSSVLRCDLHLACRKVEIVSLIWAGRARSRCRADTLATKDPDSLCLSRPDIYASSRSRGTSAINHSVEGGNRDHGSSAHSCRPASHLRASPGEAPVQPGGLQPARVGGRAKLLCTLAVVDTARARSDNAERSLRTKGDWTCPHRQVAPPCPCTLGRGDHPQRPERKQIADAFAGPQSRVGSSDCSRRPCRWTVLPAVRPV